MWYSCKCEYLYEYNFQVKEIIKYNWLCNLLHVHLKKIKNSKWSFNNYENSNSLFYILSVFVFEWNILNLKKKHPYLTPLKKKKLTCIYAGKFCVICFILGMNRIRIKIMYNMQFIWFTCNEQHNVVSRTTLYHLSYSVHGCNRSHHVNFRVCFPVKGDSGADQIVSHGV